MTILARRVCRINAVNEIILMSAFFKALWNNILRGEIYINFPSSSGESLFAVLPDLLILKKTRQVSSVIHSARPTVSPLVNVVFAWNLLWFARFWKVRTDGQHVRKQWSLPAVTVDWSRGSKDEFCFSFLYILPLFSSI